MNNEIMKPGGERRPLTKAERQTAQARAQIKNEVQIAALMADGVIAFGAHVMEGITELDGHRRELAGDDQLLNLALGEIEAQTLRQTKAIQRGLYNGMG